MIIPNNPRRRGQGAPIVPTSNMRVKRPQVDEDMQMKKPSQGAQNQFQQGSNFSSGGLASGAPQLTGNSGLQHVTGPGVQHPNDPTNPSGNQGMGTGYQDVAPVNTQSNDELANQAIAELLKQGPRNTADEEALINEMLQSTVGKGQADLNARLGAGGFGTSGALGALSGDMRANAAQKAAGDIMQTRQSARDEWLDRVSRGLDSEFKDRGMDMSEEQFQAYLDALMAANGIAPTGGPGQATQAPDASTGTGTLYDGLTQDEANALHQHLEEESTQDRADSAGGQRAMQDAQEVSEPPMGGQFVGSDGGYKYYVVHNYNDMSGNPNTYYKVKAS